MHEDFVEGACEYLDEMVTCQRIEFDYQISAIRISELFYTQISKKNRKEVYSGKIAFSESSY